MAKNSDLDSDSQTWCPDWEKTSFKIDHVCNLGYFPMSMYVNPIYLTVRQILEHDSCPPSGSLGEVIPYEKTILYEYYKWIQKNNENGLFSVLEKITGESLKKSYKISLSSSTCYAPWICATNTRNRRHHNFFYSRGKTHGRHKWKSLLALIASMRDKGYIPEKNLKSSRNKNKKKYNVLTCHYIERECAVQGIQRRVFINRGNHRVAVFFALFPDQEMTVLLDRKLFVNKFSRHPTKNIYKRKQYRDWPDVKRSNGKDSSGSMELEIFDYYFNIGKKNKTPWRKHLNNLSKKSRFAKYDFLKLDCGE